MVHLPVHASWLNQVEVYFSVIQRKLLTPDDFEDPDELATQILAFESTTTPQACPASTTGNTPSPGPRVPTSGLALGIAFYVAVGFRATYEASRRTR
jgi:hypothetical protein